MDLNFRHSWLICMLSSQLIHYLCKVCSHCQTYVYGRARANEVYLIPQATGIPGSQSSQKNCCYSALLDDLGFKTLLFPVMVGLWQRMYAMIAYEMRWDWETKTHVVLVDTEQTSVYMYFQVFLDLTCYRIDEPDWSHQIFFPHSGWSLGTKLGHSLLVVGLRLRVTVHPRMGISHSE